MAWPHARRDDYFAPELIPEDDRQPIAGSDGGIFPGEPGLRPGGVPYPKSAAREGGPRNGVLTAVEDFVARREGLRLVVVPAFFGFGVVVAQTPVGGRARRDPRPVGPQPDVERLEGNRVHHLAQDHSRQVELWRLQERRGRQEAVLQRLLESSAFGLAERLSRLRMRAGVASRADRSSRRTRSAARSRTRSGARARRPERASLFSRRSGSVTRHDGRRR